MDIGKSITFIFEDPDWLKKVAIGTGLILLGMIFMVVLIGLVPLIIVTGYTVVLIKNVMDGVEHPLPEWEDWGDLFMRGLKIFLIQLIWAIPLIIVSMGTSLPAALSENSDIQGLWITASVFCGCLSLILGIALALAEPVITFRFARTGEFGSGFEFGKIFRLLGDNIVNVIIAIIVAAVVGSVLFIVGMLVGTILLLIGLIVTIPAAVFLASLVEAHLFGQVGREAEAKEVISDQ
ncbi:MAG: DUF4013 domain-containing protein [Chloroflexi bacterium]|nr:DUF4013 domain-containing protein [Chloroflexota bacterium]